MASVGTAFVDVRADLKGFSDDVSKAGDGIGTKFTEFGKTAAKAFAAGVATIGVGAAFFGKKTIDAASDFNETLSKSNTVFGDSASEIKDWSKTSSRALGQSQTQALAAASTFGNMFDQLGIGSGQAADMSKQMVGLASDFASFHNADITDVLEAQTAAFRGEYDGVQKYVPTINAAAVEQKALSMGLKGSAKELTAQDKALATQALLMEGAGDAAGDFARTSGGLANQQRILSAQFDDIKVRIGQFLIPLATKFFGFLNTTAIPAVSNLVKVFDEQGLAGVFRLVQQRVAEMLPIVQAKLTELAQAFWGWVQDVTPPLLEKLGELLQALGSWLIDTALPAIGEKLQAWGKAFVEWVAPLIPPALQELGKLLGALGTWILDEGLPLLVEKVKEWGKAFLEWVGPIIGPMLVEIGKLLIELNNWLITEALPKIIGKLAEWGLAFGEWIVTEAVPALIGKLPDIWEAIRKWATDDALPKIKEKLKEFATAAWEWVKDAVEAAPGQLRDFGRAVVDGIVEAIKKVGGEIWDAIMDLVPSPSDIAKKIGLSKNDLKIDPFTGERVEGRAVGGPVAANTPYWVGENAPELFVPRRSGQILNLSQLGDLGSGARAGNTYNFYGTNGVTAAEVERETRRKELLYL